ncbi:MAG TPA: CPBP family glutamic-type intramembrane protease [Pedobacter sp.]
MFGLRKALSGYLSYPGLTVIPEQVQRPLNLLLKLTVICITAGVAAGLFSGMLVHLKLIPDPGPSLLENKEVSHFEFFIGAVCIAPVIEELIFRAQLRRFSASILFFSFICGVLLSSLTGTNWAFLISPVIFIPLFIIYRYTLAGSVTRKFMFWKRVFPWHFYFTAICFGLVHLGNYEKGITLLPLGIIYTLPQLAIGLVLGFTRMNYGLKYSMALHALYNLSLAVLLFSKY